jgi:hypothetical protein
MATRFSQYRSVAPALVEHRAAPRHRVQVTRATLSKRGNQPVDAELHDLSIYGCRFACHTQWQEGDRLWLRFGEGLPIAATAVWNDGDYLGCRFDAPIPRSLMRSLTLVIC